MSRLLRVAISSAHPLVQRGVETLLSDYPDRILATHLKPAQPTTSGHDVIIYDAAGIRDDGDDSALRRLVETQEVPVVALVPHVAPELASRSRDAGARAVITSTVTPGELVDVLEAIALNVASVTALPGVHLGPVKGLGVGLTLREQTVVELIARGMSNSEIAAELYVSSNTVKTYIRTAYRKIGTTSRTQAVIWALNHGTDPSPRRTERAGEYAETASRSVGSVETAGGQPCGADCAP